VSALCTAPCSNERAPRWQMQAFAIVVWLVQLDIFRARRLGEIEDVDVAQSASLALKEPNMA